MCWLQSSRSRNQRSLACLEYTLASHTARCRLVLVACRLVLVATAHTASRLVLAPCLHSASTALASSLPRCAYSQARYGSMSRAMWHGTNNDGSRWAYGGEPNVPRRGYMRWARVSRCGRVATALVSLSRSTKSSPTMTMIPSSAATAGAVAAHRPPQMSMGEAAMKTEGTGGTSG